MVEYACQRICALLGMSVEEMRIAPYDQHVMILHVFYDALKRNALLHGL